MYDLYRELILDHAKNMRNEGLLDPNNFDHEEHNPLCGDRIHLTMQVDEQGIIQLVGWESSGCALSRAAASMLGEKLIGMPLAEAKKLDKEFVLEMVGIPLTLNRIKCATLGLKTLLIGAYGTEHWEHIEDKE
jgi:nitrogen fixation protein NifU and related proteins